MEDKGKYFESGRLFRKLILLCLALAVAGICLSAGNWWLRGEVELSAASGGQKVDSRIVEPLNEMLSAMRQEGLRPLVCSGYRTVENDITLEEYLETADM